MGIKCSLLGHDFGEAAVERDREEQGNEVVSTIREVETCRRCGETRVVSENTEVTTIKTPDDIDVETDPDEDRSGDVPTEGTAVGPDSTDAGDEGPISEAETPSEPGAAGDDTKYESAAEDDGVILEDDTDEDPDRDPGEWPEAESADEPGEDDEPADDGVVLDGPAAESTTAADTAGEADSGGLNETATDSAGEDSPDEEAEVWSATRPDLESATEDVETAGTTPVVDGTFRCTECGFTTPVESSSLREGDYCPECHRGMLVVESAGS